MFRTVHAEHCIMNEWGSKVFEVRFLRCLDQGKEVNNKLENSESRNVDPVPFAFLAQLAPQFTLQHQRPSGDF